ncbi:putative quinol monooxygenase [Aerosakkonemataceae cyanobacterium BLCC-F50]|uniref:Quinol monooxygenase n=1 Tax=Floridaenema flaviceps BLCC-F50 TaxID=3153642 RepID=A0ABV4XLQ6_9CYAN
MEKWESQETLDAHLASEHLQNAIAKLPQLIASGPDIRRYTLLDS